MKVPDGKATRDTIFNVHFGSFADSSHRRGHISIRPRLVRSMQTPAQRLAELRADFEAVARRLGLPLSELRHPRYTSKYETMR